MFEKEKTLKAPVMCSNVCEIYTKTVCICVCLLKVKVFVNILMFLLRFQKNHINQKLKKSQVFITCPLKSIVQWSKF